MLESVPCPICILKICANKVNGCIVTTRINILQTTQINRVMKHIDVHGALLLTLENVNLTE